ncbi:IS5/IS1182 family transposase, partial [Ralstonia solanacearum species complex bacterium RW470]
MAGVRSRQGLEADEPRRQINLKHPLVRLADLIDWNRLSAVMSESFVSKRGRPATSPRLI